MTALIASILVTLVMGGVVVVVARRRTPGAPLTWGEAYVAALFVFVLMLFLYGIVPNQWLQYADSNLKWRSDKIGIPLGGLGFGHWHLLKSPYRLFPQGITFFGRGRITVTAVALRDLVVTVIYLAALVGQSLGWLWWQNRGKKKVEVRELTSAYGRPLVKKA